MTVRILTGDCRATLATLDAGSAQMCVTSPPYFGLRDYGHAGQIGLEATPDAYVAELVAVFREVRRILKPDGVLFLNLGDSYFGSTMTGGNKSFNASGGEDGFKQQRQFKKPSGARRAGACDTSDKAPEDSPASDCFCQSLCGACRAAYRIGKSHSARPPVPTPAPSPFAPILGSTESAPDHSPTSGSVLPVDHTEAATLDSSRTPAHDGGQLPCVRESTTGESSLPSPDSRSPVSSPDAGCRLCGCSLPDSTLASADTTACTCDTGSRSGASDQSKMGTLSGDLAYPSIATTSLKSKDLIGIPWRVAFALQADGWYLRSDIIWHKPNPMPESVTDRPTKSHEYLFLLAKSERYYYDAGAIAEASVTDDNRRPYTSAGAWDLDGRPVEQRHGGEQRKAKGNYKGSSFNRGKTATNGNGRQQADDERTDAEGLSGTRNKRTVWTIATQPFKGAHFATFPPALIEPCILAGSAKGDTVLDPFGGAGTTGLVADRLGRDAILCELNPAYAEMATKRLRDDGGMFMEVAS